MADKGNGRGGCRRLRGGRGGRNVEACSQPEKVFETANQALNQLSAFDTLSAKDQQEILEGILSWSPVEIDTLPVDLHKELLRSILNTWDIPSLAHLTLKAFSNLINDQELTQVAVSCQRMRLRI